MERVDQKRERDDGELEADAGESEAVDEDQVVVVDAKGVVHKEARDEQELPRRERWRTKWIRTADNNDSPSDLGPIFDPRCWCRSWLAHARPRPAYHKALVSHHADR